MENINNTEIPSFIIRNLKNLGMEFEISGKKVIITDIDTLLNIADNIYDYCDLQTKNSYVTDKYQLIESDVDLYLQECVYEKDGQYYYDVGEDFAFFAQDLNQSDDDTEYAYDNKITQRRVEQEFDELTNNKYNIFYEAETDFCHVYALDKEAAIAFLRYTVERWLIPYINTI
jgi:hypothetical protein